MLNFRCNRTEVDGLTLDEMIIETDKGEHLLSLLARDSRLENPFTVLSTIHPCAKSHGITGFSFPNIGSALCFIMAELYSYKGKE